MGVWAMIMEPIISMVDEKWNKTVQGSNLFVIQRKLHFIKVRMKEWCLMYKMIVGLISLYTESSPRGDYYT